MNRLWRISKFSRAEYFIVQKCRKLIPNVLQSPKLTSQPLLPIQFHREYETKIPSEDARQTSLSNVISIFEDKRKCGNANKLVKEKLGEPVSVLKDKILGHTDDLEKIEKVLEEDAVDLFRKYNDGAAVVELMNQLKDYPLLAIEVLNWRRKHHDIAAPMNVNEYSKGIVVTGRLHNLDLAIELFNEASNKKLKTTYLYNALMSAYAHNGLARKCQSVFQDLKEDPTCAPSIVTYNILIFAYGNLVLMDHMEATLKEMKDLNLTPTVHTFHGLISGYIRAFMWEAMDTTYSFMRRSTIKPDMDTQLLMLRGYAHSGQLEKMEEMYEVVRYHVDQKEIHLLRYMVRAYCMSSDVDRVEKVEKLLKRIPGNGYRSWLNVVLICFYAKEDLMDRMESWIDVAFAHKTDVTTVRVMRCIISSYFRQNAVDKLEEFLQRAGNAGWVICRSLFHCKMVMYLSQRRLSEMESVLEEMAKINMPMSKKTFWILYKAYGKWDERSQLEKVAGMMYKRGHGLPLGDF